MTESGTISACISRTIRMTYKDFRSLSGSIIIKCNYTGTGIKEQVTDRKKVSSAQEETKTAKRSVSMANKYYQNMSRVSNEPQFMDKKKIA